MNNNINMRGKAKEIDLIQYSIGVLQGTNSLYSNTQLDRNNGNILNQLKSNEFSIKYQVYIKLKVYVILWTIAITFRFKIVKIFIFNKWV